MIIGVPKEILEGENRVAVVPDVATKLIKAGFEIHIEKDAGLKAGFTDSAYQQAGVKIFSDLTGLYNSADIILKVQRPLNHPELNKHELDLMRKGTLLITFLYPLYYTDLVKKSAELGINVISAST